MISNSDSKINTREGEGMQSVALNHILEACEQQLLQKPVQDEQSDGMVFLAPPYEALPTIVAKDPLLRPIDKLVYFNIWIWGKENGSQQAAFPSYEYLERSCNAARGTIASSLKKLRTHGLIVLSRSIRDGKGRYRGNIYVINPEPMSLGETIQLDPDYITFLQQCAEPGHAKHLRQLAVARLNSLHDDIATGVDVLDTNPALQTERRLKAQRAVQSNSKAFDFFGINEKHIHIIKRKKKSQVQNLNSVKSPEKQPSSKFELGEKPSLKTELGHSPSSVFEPSSNSKLNSVGSSSIYKTTTTTSDDVSKYTAGTKNLVFDKNVQSHQKELTFMLDGVFQSGVKIPPQLKEHYDLKSVSDYFQFLLDELNTAIEAKLGTNYPVKNPSTYLMGMFNKAAKGQYQPNGGYSKATTRRKHLDAHRRAKKAPPAPAQIQKIDKQAVKVDPKVFSDMYKALGRKDKYQG